MILSTAIWVLTTLTPSLALNNGGPRCITFNSSDAGVKLFGNGQTVPIITQSSDDIAVHIAAQSFASDFEVITGVRPKVYNDTAPGGTDVAIIVGTSQGGMMDKMGTAGKLQGSWESYDIRTMSSPMDGVSKGVVITGSDRRGAIYGMYELSEQMGISPWWWWADVSPTTRSYVGFISDSVCAHGDPHVKYRGLFINDEQPALWNWAKAHFNMGDQPPFQTQVYQPLFETLLRLKANYFWPAMWSSMFDVDGMDVSNGLPAQPIAGPNQALAQNMGIVMGTSHQEPMARNTPEWSTYGKGEWNFTVNRPFLEDFWRYGAERARSIDAETLFTVGMRGNGDLPLPGANIPIMETEFCDWHQDERADGSDITATQQGILKQTYNGSDVPQMWCMYKEVMGYFANGLQVPDDVTILLADDNWGNLMAVLPWGENHTAGGGIYYHVDYVGDPRDYKWINSAPLAKMWEQMNVASVYNTTDIWILNVGDMKMNELPSEYFLSLAYDSEQWPLNTLTDFLTVWASREFGSEHAAETADIMGRYQFMASRLKAELVNSTTYSLINYNEAETLIDDWCDIESRAAAVHSALPDNKKTGYYELVYAPILLNANLNKLYIEVGKSNLHSNQYRSSANIHAKQAQDHFANDAQITSTFEALENGKWPFMLAQPHINYQYWQQPVRNTLPPISFVQQSQYTYPGSWVSTRYTVENSLGAWPGDNVHNCAQGYNCPDPHLTPMDPYGAKSRWVDVSSGGPDSVSWSATSNDSWLQISTTNGQLVGDGSKDCRVWLTPDWSSAPNGSTTAMVNFTSSDGATTIVTVPLNNTMPPPSGWTGFAEGDGYVAIEAAHATTNSSAQGYTFQEIHWLGRTASGIKMFPVSNQNFTLGEGPRLEYAFWTSGDAYNTSTGTVQVTIQMSPVLNYILGKHLMFGMQMDDAAPMAISPIPDAPLGSLPPDWTHPVASEIRNVTMEVPLSNWETPGAHTLTLWGMSTGIVFERVLIDMGGMRDRGYSYLGPPESKRVGQA